MMEAVVPGRSGFSALARPELSSSVNIMAGRAVMDLTGGDMRIGTCFRLSRYGVLSARMSPIDSK